MLQLVTAIPDVDALLALEPEELGAKILFLIRSRQDAAMFNVGNLRGELWTQNFDRQLYPRNRKADIDLAVAEAFAWLEAQGLIVPAEGMNGKMAGVISAAARGSSRMSSIFEVLRRRVSCRRRCFTRKFQMSFGTNSFGVNMTLRSCRP